MFDFLHCEKKFEGKWKGKGHIITKDCNKKFIKKKILTKLIIKKIKNNSYQIWIRNKIDEKYSNIELLGFINKETNILECQNAFGISQFYFSNFCFINSFNKNKNKHLSTCTIKLNPDIKHCSSSSSSSCFSSCSSSCKCYKKKY